jgi:dipeptidyl-peptidase-4
MSCERLKTRLEPEPMNWPLRIALALACILADAQPGSWAVAAEKKDPSRLTVSRIFDANEFVPEHVSARWTDVATGYTTLEPTGRPIGGRDIVRHDPATAATEIVVAADLMVPSGKSAPLAIDDYAFSADHSHLLIFTNSERVWRTNSRGDFWVLDRSSHELFKLGGDVPAASLMHAKFAPDGLRVGYVRSNNIYVQDLREHKITQLTSSTSADDINGTFDWVYEEEFGLRDGFRWSPDGTMIAYWHLDTKGVREFPLINNTDSLYPRLNPIKYPKVGETNASCRLGVVPSAGGATLWLEISGDPRNHYIAFMEWVEGSNDIIFQQFNRHQNTVRLLLANAHTGQISTIFTDHDDAWLDQQTRLHWIKKKKEFLWLSERDGWRHIYRAARAGGELERVTAGDFDVIEILAVDQESDWIYFTASPDNPTQRYLFAIHSDGSNRQRITPAPLAGTNDYEISPDGRWAIHQFSAFNTVPTTTLDSLPAHRTIRILTESKALKEKIGALNKVRTEFFRVDVAQGVALDGWCMYPPDFDPKAKYPLLVHVYGEPAGQTVLDRWGGGNHLWHQMLAQDGYIVMSFDNRGTPSPRGRAWRKSVYHQIGVLAPKDQAEAVKEVLRKRPYVDPDRIGIWGWSGGGSMSLNAIFKYPDLYKTAIAVAPVSNQRYYDTIYQERYMGLPGDNVDGFTQGSPINFAHQLKGNLLVIHGTGDDNCHYQATEALINELIVHNKHFTMMAYPNRSHAISEGRNTTLHLRELMTRYLKENLPPGPKPRARDLEKTGSEK